MTNMEIKPIETVYNGYKFRSRLEARWAVFFDTLGIDYEYEKEGFELCDGTKYLPDFWLPTLDCWFEVKGEYPTDAEKNKVENLSLLTNETCFIAYGKIPNFEDEYGLREDSEEKANILGYNVRRFDDDEFDYSWWENLVFLTYEYPEKDRGIHIDHTNQISMKQGSLGREIIAIEGYKAARQARFEHGEGETKANQFVPPPAEKPNRIWPKTTRRQEVFV